MVRWKEGIWQRRGRSKKARAVHVGDRVVTGEVLKDAGDGRVCILVRKCEIPSEKWGRQLTPLAKGTEIRRKRSTIERAHPERMAWSDETARGALHSRFLGKR